ncbi:hypothetical protein MBANPS3_000157, partial [Mucor bainieri]
HICKMGRNPNLLTKEERSKLKLAQFAAYQAELAKKYQQTYRESGAREDSLYTEFYMVRMDPELVLQYTAVVAHSQNAFKRTAAILRKQAKKDLTTTAGVRYLREKKEYNVMHENELYDMINDDTQLLGLVGGAHVKYVSEQSKRKFPTNNWKAGCRLMLGKRGTPPQPNVDQKPFFTDYALCRMSYFTKIMQLVLRLGIDACNNKIELNIPFDE